MKKQLIAVASMAAMIWSAGVNAAAVTITQWNFNSPSADANTGTGTTFPSIGAGTSTVIGGVTSSFASGDASGGSSDPAVGDDSGWQTTTYAAQGTGDKTRGAQFLVGTTGFKDITVGYDLRHSNTSSRYEQVQYTLDGSTWLDSTVFDGNAGDTWFNGRAVDFSSIAGASNNANFGVRILATFAPGTSAYASSSPTGTYGTAGTWRFDMVTVSGSPVPVPAALPLMFSGLTLLGAFLRRRNARGQD